MEAKEIIDKIRAELLTAKEKIENSPSSKAVSIGDDLFNNIFTEMGKLRIHFKENPEVILLCEDLAIFYLECGNKVFRENKHATTTVDNMLKAANITTSGINISDNIKTQIDNCYQDWHWHGW